MKVVLRKIALFEHEERMKYVAIEEVGRFVSRRVERGFVLPSATIEATSQEERAFLLAARKELGTWHSRWNFYLGAANKRRAFRELNDEDRLLLVSGVLILDGTIERFSTYERDYRMSKLSET
jgi:hypothetical protein